MPIQRSLRVCLLLVFTACALAIGVCAAQAATPLYGELSRFGAGVEDAGNAHAFGVDKSEGNSVFVGSEPAAGEYAIKEFSEAGTLLGSVTFTPPVAEFPEKARGIEGIAIDEAENRAYVLITTLDAVSIRGDETAAGALYAFSTKPSGKALVHAPGITNAEGLFASTATLHATSKTAGGSSADPLLEPAGITVDPTTHEVIILGFDEESTKFPEAPHVALQRVAIKSGSTPAGELGARYIDPQADGTEEPNNNVNSPIVTTAGNVFFAERSPTDANKQEIVQVPRSFAATAPKAVYTASNELGPLDETEQLVEFPPSLNGAEPKQGGALSYTSEGGGRIYSYAMIAEDEELNLEPATGEPEEAEFESTPNPGVLALNYLETGEQANVSEIGWTAGQRPALFKGGPEEVKCSIGPAAENSGYYPLVAAGSGEKLFVLGWTALGKTTKTPIVEEFGPKGVGCFEAHGEMLVETTEDEVVKETQSVKANTELALRGFIYEGNAHKVEWNFDEGGAPVVVEGDEHQETTITHDFEGNGPGDLEPIVTETVHTDNLADPVTEVTRKVKLLEIAPTHIKAPVNAEAPEGGSASFTASAAGGNMKVQWEVETPGGSFKADTTDTGNTTGTLTVSSVTAAENGNKYRASFKNGKGGPVTSKEATLTVGAGGTKAPEVTEQPKSVEVVAGAEASFKAAASGTPAPTVQWEESTNGGASFGTVPGATSSTLKVAGTKVTESGDEYRAAFKNSAGEQTTSAATLTVNAAPEVTEQPQSVEVAEGAEASFKAAASGSPAPTVKWEKSTDEGATFNEVPGATSTTFKVASAKLSESGDEYRAVFKNSVGEKTTSAATLTVTAKPVAPEVTEQPKSVEVAAGAEASFKAAASGTPAPTVQWEESTNGGASFGTVPGATSPTLKVVGTKVTENGDEYRAVFKNSAGEKTTTVATLTVKGAPEVTEQPKSVEVVEGAEASFKAAASGNPAPTVQWEESTNGGTSFSPVPGATTTTLKIASTKPAESDDEYRAVFKNSVGEKTTSAATLTVTAKPVAPEVTEQPASVEVAAGAEASFKAAASGTPAPTVHWEESTNGGTSFSPVPGATTTTLKIASTKPAENGDEYRAVFKNSAGEKTTGVATLTVKAAPEVTKQPLSITVLEGAEAKLEAAASGVPAPTVQWEESTNGGTSFSPVAGATSDTVKIASAKVAESGDQYRAAFKNSLGEKTTSAATLTVEKLSSPPPPCSVACSPPPPPPPPPPGEGGVLPVKEGSPEAKLMSRSFSVSTAGKLTLKVTCTGIHVKSCAGTITLRTLKAVSTATAGAKHKASILTLATTSYSVAAGQSEVLTLRLASKARTVLARSHTLAAKSTILAHDPEGGVHSTGSVVTLRLAKSKHG